MSAASQPVDGTRLGWTIAALGASAAPHFAHLPAWPLGIMLCMALWRLAVQAGRAALPGVVLRLALALAAFAGVLLTYQAVSGLDAGSALLVVMAALKLTETRFVRDLVVLNLIGYFLIVTQFLFAQTIVTALYAVPALWLVTTALLQATSPAPPLPWRRAFGRAGLLLAHALPLMIIAFVLFPRLSGPFWGIARNEGVAITGLSDSMSPGSITRLLQSDAVAFRARFTGPAPPASQRYWRGLVLSNFDGRRWSLYDEDDRKLAHEIEVTGEPLRYEVTLEPHQQRWLFALEQAHPRHLPAYSYMTNDRRVLRRRPVTRLYRYALQSYPGYRAARAAQSWELDRDLYLPPRRNERAVALAARWAADGQQAVVERALAYFREQPFFYTLTAPALPSADPVDEFLFTSRRGFCEHYASAFTVLMRAAGIPARVVVGYQGGELNPFGDHMTVRQSDAHAWSEVWLDGRGWVRVDPTAAVAPERVELGVGAALPAGETLPGLLRHYAWLQRVRYGLDVLNNGWNEWVLGFSREKQERLLERLGMPEPTLRKMLLTLIALSALVLGVMALQLLWQARPARRDTVLRAYDRLCRKLAPIAGPRAPGEGPLDYSRRVAGARPELGAQVGYITALYVALRYGPPSAANERDLRRLVRTLRVR